MIEPSVSSFSADPLTPESRLLLDAWHHWRGARLLPNRSEVELRDITRILPWVLILEFKSIDEAIFRLAGSQYREELGFEPTGLNYVALAKPADRRLRGALLQAELAQPCGATMIYRQEYASGLTVPVEILSLPLLRDDEKTPSQVIVVSTKLASARGYDDISGKNYLPAGEDLRFIDIGAGVPDKSAIIAQLAATGSSHAG